MRRTVRARDLRPGDVIWNRGLRDGVQGLVDRAVDGACLEVTEVTGRDGGGRMVVRARHVVGGRGEVRLRPRPDDAVEVTR